MVPADGGDGKRRVLDRGCIAATPARLLHAVGLLTISNSVCAWNNNLGVPWPIGFGLGASFYFQANRFNELFLFRLRCQPLCEFGKNVVGGWFAGPLFQGFINPWHDAHGIVEFNVGPRLVGANCT